MHCETSVSPGLRKKTVKTLGARFGEFEQELNVRGFLFIFFCVIKAL